MNGVTSTRFFKFPWCSKEMRNNLHILPQFELLHSSKKLVVLFPLFLFLLFSCIVRIFQLSSMFTSFLHFYRCSKIMISKWFTDCKLHSCMCTFKLIQHPCIPLIKNRKREKKFYSLNSTKEVRWQKKREATKQLSHNLAGMWYRDVVLVLLVCW